MPGAEVRSVEEWMHIKNTPEWLFKATAAGQRWEYGPSVEPTAVTEEVYDAAIHRAQFERV